MAAVPGAQQGAQEPAQPLSPWAQRFGVSTPVRGDPTFKRGGCQHSGYAPERMCS
jgi:hypothetical protein